MDNNMLWYWLCNIDGIGNKKISKLMNVFSSVEELFYYKSNIDIKGISSKDWKSIQESKSLIKIEENYHKLKSKDVCFVSQEDKAYPEGLKEIFDPPYGLYVKGKLPSDKDKVIAIIGSRTCTDYGRELCKYFSYELSKVGVHIISGLATGVDGYAHEGALEADGVTYGVLGSGIDVCYPKENYNYYRKMNKKGGIISEYGLNVSPKPGFFPMRNRIISGLSQGILVIEAKEKSGSLITVDYGLDQGKNIYALPGRITDSQSSGCNNLIKMGAKLVTSPMDILEDLSVNCIDLCIDNKKNHKLLESKEKIVYACLSLQGKHISDLWKETNIEINELTNILIKLELDNFIKEIRPNYYIYNLEFS